MVGVVAAARGALRAPRGVLHPARAASTGRTPGWARATCPTSREPRRPTPGSPATSCSCPAGTPTGTCWASSRSASRPPACARPTTSSTCSWPWCRSPPRALQGAQEAVEAARHRNALEQLLQVSSRLSERRSIDEVLQEVCDGVAGALDFQKVMIELVDPETGLLTPRAVAGWDDVSHAPQWRVSVDEIRPLLDPDFEVEGCFLVPQTAAIARMPQRTAFTSTMNGRGPHAWDHHWLVVPLYDQAGQIFGRIWADDPADRLLPSPSRLQALRVFANQAMMAVIAAGHVEQLRAQADRDSLTGMLNRRAFMRELAHRDRALPALRAALRAGPLRPRRVQADQRHRRPPGGRPCAGGRRRPAGAHHPRQRLRLPHRRRRVRPAAARDRRRRGAGGGRADRGRAGGRQRARRGPGHQLRPGALPGPTARRPRSSSAAPTRRSTRPSAPTTTCTSRRAPPERSYTRGRGGPRTRRRRHLERRALHALRRGDRRRAPGRPAAPRRRHRHRPDGRHLRVGRGRRAARPRPARRRARVLLPGRRRGPRLLRRRARGVQGLPALHRSAPARARAVRGVPAHGDRALAASASGSTASTCCCCTTPTASATRARRCGRGWRRCATPG